MKLQWKVKIISFAFTSVADWASRWQEIPFKTTQRKMFEMCIKLVVIKTKMRARIRRF